ncbi:MAG: iron-sulfur cluster assembly scaffold protein [Campylobacterota bacterium]|nr:iron-sulfur cluster assembly scaffold protein [Campylobacterota bacterium]
MKNIKQENQEKLEQTGDVASISAEVLDHMMNPKNYGVMEDNDGVGMGADTKTGEFAMVYIKLNGEILENISFGCNACQDTVVAGSLFTEMVKGDTLDNAVKALMLMDEKLYTAPKKQQACSRMVLQAFRAAIINKENRVNGMDEDLFTINLKESCEGINQEGDIENGN